MMNNLPEDMISQPVFDWFDKILQIPRPSGKEDKIKAFLLQFAAERNLPTKTDEAGNLLITKPAAHGYENSPTIVLQTHLDMVCEKHNSTSHDFLNDPIQAYVEDGWIKAKDTTLGADDGIGIAAQLTVLDANTLKHGPIECLFTVEEETGLTGAFGLKEGFLSGKTLINLDSEDDGELFIGCAGGIDTIASFRLETDIPRPGSFAFNLKVDGLKGGHSGDDIHKGHGNAIQILIRYLFQLQHLMPVTISNLQGGNLRNAIPREAEVTVIIPTKKKEAARVALNIFIAEIENELRFTDTGFKMHLSSTEMPELVFDKGLTERILKSLYACPNGVQQMSFAMPGLVETSTNLASIKSKVSHLEVVTSQRSSVETRKDEIAQRIEAIFSLAGAHVEHSDGYPGWEPRPKSDVVKQTVESYESLFGEKPIVRAIHAGLECGLFLKKYPSLDMVSFGPTIRGAHSPEERLEIATVEKFWLLLVDVLKRLC